MRVEVRGSQLCKTSKAGAASVIMVPAKLGQPPTAAPYVSAAAPYAIPVGGDAVLLNGVINEVQSGMSGQCTW
jgi:hypothetical protein